MKMRKNTEGFSLIELTVVMVIIGLLMAGVFAYLNVNLQQKKIDNTLDHTKQNLASLQDFITKDLVNAAGQKVDRSGNVLLATDTNTYYEHRLPCPATPGLKPGDPDFGVEQCPPGNSTFKGVKVATGTAGQRVFIGAYPSATLQTYGENSVDGYRGAYVYAVTKSLTNKTLEPVQTGKEPGAVIVQYIDKNDKLTTYPNKPFALISTGENGTAANASNLDFENNNGDATFLAQENRSSNPDFFYDDRVSFGFTESAEPQNCQIGKLDVQVFEASGIWIKPEKLSYVVVEMWAAQGGPSGGGKALGGVGPYGEYIGEIKPGGDGYGKKLLSADEFGSSASIAVTIGAGGNGGEFPNYFLCTSGADGGTTSLGNLVTMTGGKGSVVTSKYCSDAVQGKPATQTGADYFWPTPVTAGYTAPNHKAIMRSITKSCRQIADSGDGTDTICEDVAIDGRGHDGQVTITSYVCK